MAKKFFIIFGILFFAASAFAGEWKMRYNSFTRKQDWIRGDDPVFTSITADTLSDGTLTITGGSITDLVNLTGTGTLTIDDIDLDGSITMDDTETVDGVDISVLDSTVAALDLDAVSDVGATTDQIITTGGYTTDGTLTDGTLEISGGNLSTTGTLGAGAITGTSLDAGSGTIQTTGAITDGTFSVDDGVMTGIASLNGAGTIDLEDNLDGTGFTGTFGQIIDNGLDVSEGVYTDANKQLTSTIPTTDNINLGFWNRTGTTLTQATAEDILDLTGQLRTTQNFISYPGPYIAQVESFPVLTPTSDNHLDIPVYGLAGYTALDAKEQTYWDAGGDVVGLLFSNATVFGGGSKTNTGLYGAQLYGAASFWAYIRGKLVVGAKIQSILGVGNTFLGLTTANAYDVDEAIGLWIGVPSVTGSNRITTETALRVDKPVEGSTKYQVDLKGNGDGSGIWFDAERLYSDGTNLTSAAPILALDKIKFTQTDGNEYIDSLADGYMDLGATTGIRLNDPTTVTGLLTTDEVIISDVIAAGTEVGTALFIGSDGKLCTTGHCN